MAWGGMMETSDRGESSEKQVSLEAGFIEQLVCHDRYEEVRGQFWGVSSTLWVPGIQLWLSGLVEGPLSSEVPCPTPPPSTFVMVTTIGALTSQNPALAGLEVCACEVVVLGELGLWFGTPPC